MHTPIPAILPLAVLEAVQNIDTPPDDGLGALQDELASKRLGLSPTVAAQVARYRERASGGEEVPGEEALAVFRLVGRRPDAALVFADAGRRAARYAARELGSGTKGIVAVAPGKRAKRALAMRAASRLASRWLLADLKPAEGIARAELLDSLPIQARDDGVACVFYTAALAELLRLVVGIEGAMVHHSCRGRGDRSCVWLAAEAGGYE
ncbi:MAG TPA: hypothetical protein PLJ23_10630 [Gemmatimonadales bacterium]|jgi:hypothetical protein|nr:hypothetical protein [Gemmatimonadales bacterium]